MTRIFKVKITIGKKSEEFAILDIPADSALAAESAAALFIEFCIGSHPDVLATEVGKLINKTRVAEVMTGITFERESEPDYPNVFPRLLM